MVVFGRRKVPVGASAAAKPASIVHPGPDADGVDRILSADLWSGPHGDLLRAAGLSPDDRSNRLETRAELDARIAAARRSEEDRRAALNLAIQREHGTGALRPFFVFGDAIWNGPHATFLLESLRFTPYDGWNVLYLAIDGETARLTKVPLHPNGAVGGLGEAAAEEVARCRAKLENLQAATAEAYAGGGGTKVFGAFAKGREEIREEFLETAERLKGRAIEMVTEVTRNLAARGEI